LKSNTRCTAILLCSDDPSPTTTDSADAEEMGMRHSATSVVAIMLETPRTRNSAIRIPLDAWTTGIARDYRLEPKGDSVGTPIFAEHTIFSDSRNRGMGYQAKGTVLSHRNGVGRNTAIHRHRHFLCADDPSPTTTDSADSTDRVTIVRMERERITHSLHKKEKIQEIVIAENHCPQRASLWIRSVGESEETPLLN